jgi:hypothetical protein
MRHFDVQAVTIDVSGSKAFAFIADPTHLPAWAHAFASVSEGRAVMRTPNGEVGIELEVYASAESGTIDWQMQFPNGSVARAHSRVIEAGSDRCIYVFILTPPPVPLEELEGTLDAQSRTLTDELRRLKELLEHDA